MQLPEQTSTSKQSELSQNMWTPIKLSKRVLASIGKPLSATSLNAIRGFAV